MCNPSSETNAFSPLFSNFYDSFMFLLEKGSLAKRRKRLLQKCSGHILEVGAGTGVNFQYYQHFSHLTAIEPSPYMLEFATRKKNNAPLKEKITLLPIGCGSPELDKLFTENSLDAIVCTLVLCTIPEPEKALQQFVKWLKPNGKLIILEHIRPHQSLSAKITDFLNPSWKKLAEGCNLNRPTDEMLNHSNLQLNRKEYFNLFLPFYEAEYSKK